MSEEKQELSDDKKKELEEYFKRQIVQINLPKVLSEYLREQEAYMGVFPDYYLETLPHRDLPVPSKETHLSGMNSPEVKSSFEKFIEKFGITFKSQAEAVKTEEDEVICQKLLSKQIVDEFKETTGG